MAKNDADPEENGEDADRATRPCPACGTQLFSRHCKYVCPNHGVVYDCSDPFYE